MTLKKIETGKASVGATTTKTSGVSGVKTLDTTAATSAMETLYTATPEDAIAAIERATAGSLRSPPPETRVGYGGILDQTGIETLMRQGRPAATGTTTEVASDMTVEQETTAAGILETGAFSSLAQRIGDATLQILAGFNKDEFGIENYNDPNWLTWPPERFGRPGVEVETSTEQIAAWIADKAEEGTMGSVSEVLCRLVQESDSGAYDIVTYDSYFIMDLETTRPGFSSEFLDPNVRARVSDAAPAAVNTGAHNFFGGGYSRFGRTASFSGNIWTHPRTIAASGTNALVFKLYIPIRAGSYKNMSIFMLAKNSSDYGNSGDGLALRNAVLEYMTNTAEADEFCGYVQNSGLYLDYEGVLLYGCADDVNDDGVPVTATAFGDAINRILDGSATINGGSVSTGALNEEIDVGSLLSPYMSVVSATADITDTTGCPGMYTQIHIVDLPLA